jgi:hypothetical protein
MEGSASQAPKGQRPGIDARQEYLLTGTFLVTGWSESTGRVVQVAVEAATADEARSTAGAEGLTLVVVQPREPPDPPAE